MTIAGLFALMVGIACALADGVGCAGTKGEPLVSSGEVFEGFWVGGIGFAVCGVSIAGGFSTAGGVVRASGVACAPVIEGAGSVTLGMFVGGRSVACRSALTGGIDASDF